MTAPTFYHHEGEIIWRGDGRPTAISTAQADGLRAIYSAEARAAYRAGDMGVARQAVARWTELTRAMDDLRLWSPGAGVSPGAYRERIMMTPAPKGSEGLVEKLLEGSRALAANGYVELPTTLSQAAQRIEELEGAMKQIERTVNLQVAKRFAIAALNQQEPGNEK